MQPIGVDEATHSAVPLAAQQVPAAGRSRLPGLPVWLRLLLSNPKSRSGLIIVLGMLAVAIFAPLLATR